jgi:hypothetical protein
MVTGKNQVIPRGTFHIVTMSTTFPTWTWSGETDEIRFLRRVFFLQAKFLFVLTEALVHRCRIGGQESHFDNFEHLRNAQNVKVVTGRLFAQKTQLEDDCRLTCYVGLRPRSEDIGSLKCRG